MTEPTTSSNKNDDNKNDNNKKNNNKNSTASFLSSMTFALGIPTDCDCDECEICISPSGDQIPPSIKDAIQQYKRQKPNPPTTPWSPSNHQQQQKRTLITRNGSVSIYQWILPFNADPMIEYGNSHRIILVHRMSKEAKIQSIGEGIIGSGMEEASRQQVLWQQGMAYLVPCNGGKALGWSVISSQKTNNNNHHDDNNKSKHIVDNKNNNNKESILDPTNNNNDEVVVLYIIKTMPNALLMTEQQQQEQQQEQKQQEDTFRNRNLYEPKWVLQVCDIFRKGLLSLEVNNISDHNNNLKNIIHDTDIKKNKSTKSLMISSEDCTQLQTIVSTLSNQAS